MWRERYVEITRTLLDQRDDLGQWTATPHAIVMLLQDQVRIGYRLALARSRTQTIH